MRQEIKLYSDGIDWKTIARLLEKNRIEATGWLSIDGPFQPLVEITGMCTWERLRYLHVESFRDTCARLGYFARLPSISFQSGCTRFYSEADLFLSFLFSTAGLEMLHLECEKYTIGHCDANLCFRNLRRLVLLPLPKKNFDQEAAAKLFTPQRMPKLVHLAWNYCRNRLYGIDTCIIDGILPQLETLALTCKDDRKTCSTTLPNCDRLSNLLHLSVDAYCGAGVIYELFPPGVAVKLQSLHLSTYYIQLDAELRRWLLSVARRTNENVEIARIVLYGGNRTFTVEEAALFEWMRERFVVVNGR